jgi:hypothetical protein
MRIIAHHTCDSKGEKGLTEIVGPFLSIHNEESPKMLGTGYYFFDNHKVAAHTHGKNRYKRQYHIFEAELILTEDIFLDLVGNRIDMIWFQEMMKFFRPNLKDREWRVGHFIEFLKKKDAFPYKAIRAVDSSIDVEDLKNEVDKAEVYYFEGKKKFLNISPIFTICLVQNDNSIIKYFKHIHSNP